MPSVIRLLLARNIIYLSFIQIESIYLIAYILKMRSLRYIPRNRYSNIADETKLLFSLSMSVIILMSYLIETQILVLALLISISILGGLKPRFVFEYMRLFLPIMVFIFLLHLFYHNGESLFSIWIFTATDFGLYSAAINFLRFINFIIITICFFSFSSPLNISSKIATGFGLAKSRFFQELALVFFIALRFLPVLIRERESLKLAMRARGVNFSGKLSDRLRNNVKLIFPLIIRVVGQTDDVAVALALKGDGDTYFVPEKVRFKLVDVSLIALSIAGILGVLYYE